MPLATSLRACCMVAFGGPLRESDCTRADRLAALSIETFPRLAQATFAMWMGHRLCMPEILPRVGPVGKRPGLWLAFGHERLGLSDSANTTKVLEALITAEVDPAASTGTAPLTAA